jgi:hypothetical protein
MVCAQAAINFKESFLATTQRAIDKSSNEIELNNGFASCTCNLTPGGCDEACCCDPDCSQEARQAWALREDYCIDEARGMQDISYEDCVSQFDEPKLNDLKGGLDVFDKLYRKSLCTKVKSSRSGSHTFDATVFNAQTSEEFTKIKGDDLETTASYSYTESSFNLDAQ